MQDLSVKHSFYAQSHAEEVCRRSGACGTRRVSREGCSPTRLHTDVQMKYVSKLTAARCTSREDAASIISPAERKLFELPKGGMEE